MGLGVRVGYRFSSSAMMKESSSFSRDQLVAMLEDWAYWNSLTPNSYPPAASHVYAIDGGSHPGFGARIPPVEIPSYIARLYRGFTVISTLGARQQRAMALVKYHYRCHGKSKDKAEAQGLSASDYCREVSYGHDLLLTYFVAELV